MLTPAIYRTRITHLRQAPVRHRFTYRGYSWYVDLDRMPRLPRWLSPFARFEVGDHFTGTPKDSLRQRVDAFLRSHEVDLEGGSVTALLQARVLGYVFNPLSLYWCHDAGGTLRFVVAEVHNTYGQRHAYLLPADGCARVSKRMYVSPFNAVDGHYRVRAPEPTEHVDVTISLHRQGHPAFVATLRGDRRAASAAEIMRLQLAAPLAPLAGALAIRFEGIKLWLRRVPVVPRPAGESTTTDRGRAL